MNSDEDILEIHVEFSDLEDEDCNKEAPEENTVPVNTFMMKVFRKGNLPIKDYCDELLSFLVNDVKLDVRGMFFKATSCVLVEVVLNSSAKSYLISIYEERLGSRVLKKKSLANIIKLCDGKFPLIVKDCVMFLVIFSNINSTLLPCRTSFDPYGLSNGDMMNILADNLQICKDFSFYDLFVAIQKDSLRNNCFNGMRIENFSTDPTVYSLRIIINRQAISNELLIKLKSAYGQISFSGDTLHFFPSHLSNDIANKFISKTLEEGLQLIVSDDLIYAGLNKFDNAKMVKDTLKIGEISASHSGETPKESIFNRLGEKIGSKRKVSVSKRQNITHKSKNVIARPALNKK